MHNNPTISLFKVLGLFAIILNTKQTYTTPYKGLYVLLVRMVRYFETLLNTFLFDSRNDCIYYSNIVSVYGLNLISNKRSYHQNLTVLEIDEASNEYRCLLHRYSCWLFLCPSISQIGNKL